MNPILLLPGAFLLFKVFIALSILTSWSSGHSHCLDSSDCSDCSDSLDSLDSSDSSDSLDCSDSSDCLDSSDCSDSSEIGVGNSVSMNALHFSSNVWASFWIPFLLYRIFGILLFCWLFVYLNAVYVRFLSAFFRNCC
jgi:hypothetical protein